MPAVRAPAKPALAGCVGHQIFLFESVRQGELLGAFTDEHDVVGVHEDVLRNYAGCLDSFERSDGPGPLGGTVHARGIQLDDAFFVWETTVADRGVVRIEFLDLDALNCGIERVHTLANESSGQLDPPETVGGRYGHVAGGAANVNGRKAILVVERPT